ncbi:MAG: hypothetical protein CL910_00550 [Deltaproteobacteria bacterium]|jgi:hypothetical protein|nr:hypothetical protein [Deltaproteobacteria bacterium]
MCTLLALHRCFPDAPLVIAANRDEYHDRPAEGPRLRFGGGRRILAPRDLREGGTWLGWNEAGLFAGLTNRPTASPDPHRRSRGNLVIDLLSEGSAKEASERLAALPAGAFNPCNLLLADGLAAYSVVLEGRPRIAELEPGAHVIGNADPNDAGHPKVGRLMQEVAPIADGPLDGAVGALAHALRMHVPEGDTRTPLEATCIHAGPYGTRSSTLYVRGRRREEDLLLYADGPPCETSFEDMTPLLAELDLSAGIASEPR